MCTSLRTCTQSFKERERACKAFARMKTTTAGIDPDVNGALAIVEWKYDETTNDDREEVQVPRAVRCEVHDCPVNVEVKSTTVKGSRVQRRSRRHDPARVWVLARRAVCDIANVRIAIEKPSPRPTDGAFGWYSVGFGYGVWRGCLAGAAMDAFDDDVDAAGIDDGNGATAAAASRRRRSLRDDDDEDSDGGEDEAHRVRGVLAAEWKKDMMLTGQHVDKEDSIALAKMLFCGDGVACDEDAGTSSSSSAAAATSGTGLEDGEHQEDVQEHVRALLKRKKDHGRAEALLIAAWHEGVRPPHRFAEEMERKRLALKEERAEKKRRARAAKAGPDEEKVLRAIGIE